MFEYEFRLVDWNGRVIGRGHFKARDKDSADKKFLTELRKAMRQESVVHGGYLALSGGKPAYRNR